jgi:HSP20 family protein
MTSDDDIDLYRGDLEGIFPGAFSPLTDSLFDVQSSSLRPLSKVEVNDQFVIVTFDVPGVNKEHISVTCTEDTVMVEAEMRKPFRTSGIGLTESSVEFVRHSKRIQLPVLVDPDKGSAKFRNGILVVKVPRLQRGKTVRITGERTKPKGAR